MYPTLQQLEDEGLIEPAASESGRRVFALTEAGQEAQTADTTSAPWEEAVEEADNELVELRDLVQQVLAATRQVAQAGTQAQIKGAQDVLRTARKGIYSCSPKTSRTSRLAAEAGPGPPSSAGQVRFPHHSS